MLVRLDDWWGYSGVEVWGCGQPFLVRFKVFLDLVVGEVLFRI